MIYQEIKDKFLQLELTKAEFYEDFDINIQFFYRTLQARYKGGHQTKSTRRINKILDHILEMNHRYEYDAFVMRYNGIDKEPKPIEISKTVTTQAKTINKKGGLNMKKALFISSIASLSSLIFLLIGSAIYANSAINSGAEAFGNLIAIMSLIVLSVSFIVNNVLAIVNYFLKGDK